jgi:Zn finger protein HypA/HybF involved in hydrogenase expression
VVLDVHGVELRVERDDLEMRAERPNEWSVVHEPHLVCPGCHQRRHITGQPKEVKCSECGHVYAVDWMDRA